MRRRALRGRANRRGRGARTAPTPSPWRATLAAASVRSADGQGMVTCRLTIRLLSPHHRLTPRGKTPLSLALAPPREISPVTRDRSLRTSLVALVVALSAFAALSFAGTAAAATKCGQQVLADWYDNGRIDKLYPLNCYEEAIDAIPVDIGPYVDAEEVITRALQGALRGSLIAGGCDPTADGSANDCARQPGGGSTGNGDGSGGGGGGSNGNGDSNGGTDPGSDPGQVAPDVDTSSPSSVPIPLL